jgi:hypothetical protein
MIAVIPSTEAMLKMLDPIRLPNDKAFSFFRAAITEAASSGTLVPMAITVTEITRSLTPSILATSTAPITNSSAPPHKATPPIMSQTAILKLEVLSRASSSPFTSIWAFLALLIRKRDKQSYHQRDPFHT